MDEIPALPTILVIDDNPTFTEELRSALQLNNFSVVTAPNGEDGLRLAAALRPSAILVDSKTAGIDGATVIRRIRWDLALRGIPCVLLTASEDRAAELSALDGGADAFVRKDDIEIVLARIRAVLRRAPLKLPLSASLLDPKRILAIDGSPTYLFELMTVLGSEGYEVVPARSGEKGIRMLDAQKVDCILLDLQMPGLDGLETCAQFKASNTTRDIPLIVLTASNDRNSMIEALASGADDIILKSADMEVLKARVRAQMRRKQIEDEHRAVSEKLLRAEMAAAEARAGLELAETRARLVGELESKNEQLTAAYHDLQNTQARLVQTAKMASLGELVAGVAHEINNPLAFVISHLGTVQRGVTSFDSKMHSELDEAELKRWERAGNRLSEMSLGLDRIRELVVKLRAFSRIDEGERKLVSIRECIEAVLMILRHRMQDEIAIEARFGEPDQVECYPGLLNQALMNLVSNAIDAVDGRGSIVVSSGACDGQYCISVADSGPGIPEALRERVLEPFFTTKATGQGTGLGLSITYSIAKKHGGTLEVLQNPGGGALFRILFPF